MATTVNTTTVSSVNTIAFLNTLTAATASTLNETEDFAAHIEAADNNAFIIIDNSEGSSMVTCTLIDSAYMGNTQKKSGVVPNGKKGVIFVDSTRCKSGGYINFRITPSLGSTLSGLKVGALQFLPVVNN